VRYYSAPGGATIVRTGTGTNYGFELAADQHGTNSLYLDNTAQTPTWRQFDPYGNPRGTTTTWPDNRTFLNKTTDTTTGLTDIGAREYDPTLGRFISLDPLFEASSPQQLGGYSYAGDNPITQSDPTGLMYDGTGGTPNCGWGCGGTVPTTPPPTCGQVKSCSETFYDPSGDDYVTWNRSTSNSGKTHASRIVSDTDPNQAVEDQVHRAEQEQAAQEQAREVAAQTRHSFWDSFSWKSSLDFVSGLAPALDGIALATAAIPIVGEIAGGLALTADAASVIDGAISVRDDLRPGSGASGLKTGLDITGTLLGGVGLSTAGVGKLWLQAVLDSDVEAAGGALTAANRASELRPRSFKASRTAAGASRQLGDAQSRYAMAWATNTVAGTMSDGISVAEGEFSIN
jgi:RHS repeat-associated protein